MKRLTDEQVDLIRAVRKRIADNPESFDQNDWGDALRGLAIEFCGTVHCLAGHTLLELHERGVEWENLDMNERLRLAADSLGLPDADVSDYGGTPDMFNSTPVVFGPDEKWGATEDLHDDWWWTPSVEQMLGYLGDVIEERRW